MCVRERECIKLNESEKIGKARQREEERVGKREGRRGGEGRE